MWLKRVILNIMKSKKINVVLLLFLLGFLVRLCVGLYLGYKLDSNYATIARNIVSGKGYSLYAGSLTAHRVPAYTLFLAGFFYVFGEKELPLIIFMALIGAFNTILCAKLGIRLFNRKTGFIAGMLYASIPYLAYQEIHLESGFVTLGLLSACLLFLKGQKENDYLFFVLCGLALGVSYLFRPTIISILLFFCLALIYDSSGSDRIPRHVAAASLLMLACFLVILPWGIRNKIVFNRWYFSQSFAWHDFHMSNHRKTFELYPRISLDNFENAIVAKPAQIPEEFAIEEWYKQQAFKELRAMGATQILKRATLKLGYLWHIRLVPYTNRLGYDTTEGILNTKRGLNKNLTFSIPYIFLIIFACLGCLRERKRVRLLLFLGGFLFFFSLPYMIFFGYSRYATQAYFVLIILAARGLITVFNKDNI
jgi:4-amino-4-deoxy-L-arabinose transferase-like glycosyltransferase